MVILAAFAVSLAAGFVPWLGEFLDLARVVVFYPFFCVGYYAGRVGLSRKIDELDVGRRRRLVAACGIAVVGLMALHYAHGPCPVEVLRRDTPYADVWDLEARAIMQVAALAWCAWLLVVTPNREAGLASEVGRNTLSVYLLHPWLIRILRHALPLPGGELAGIGICAGLSVGMLALLGNDRVARAFRYVFACGWLDARQNRQPAQASDQRQSMSPDARKNGVAKR